MRTTVINTGTTKHPHPKQNKIQVDTAVLSSTMAQCEAGEMAVLELGTQDKSVDEFAAMVNLLAPQQSSSPREGHISPP